jgi:hypothetical protein
LLSAIVWAVLCPAAVRAQAPERHFTSYPARDLYRRSAFVHGYIHGYEQGFHEADLDLHLARAPRPAKEFKAFRKADAGYERSFGSKPNFQQGYREGFREGYADAARGGSFRAVAETAAAAADLNAQPPDGTFDDGVTSGYAAGRAAGQQRTLPKTLGDCNATARAADYCDGYSRGFRLGRADAAVHQSYRQTQTAQKK